MYFTFAFTLSIDDEVSRRQMKWITFLCVCECHNCHKGDRPLNENRMHNLLVKMMNENRWLMFENYLLELVRGGGGGIIVRHCRFRWYSRYDSPLQTRKQIKNMANRIIPKLNVATMPKIMKKISRKSITIVSTPWLCIWKQNRALLIPLPRLFVEQNTWHTPNKCSSFDNGSAPQQRVD